MSENGPHRLAAEWLRAAEERLGLGFWHWDAPTRKLTCSAGLYDLIGVAAASVQLDLVFVETLVHRSDRLAISDQAELALDSRQVDRAFRLIRPDGQLLHLLGQTKRHFDRDGSPSHVIGVVANVTQVQELEQRLNRKRALLQVVARILDGGLWIADEAGQVLEQFSVHSFGESADGWRDGIHPEDAEKYGPLWRDAYSRRLPYHFSPRLKTKDGYERLHIAGMPLSRELSPEFLYGGLATRNAELVPAFVPRNSDEPLLTPEQVRACRVLLGWTADMLAAKAGISVSTVRRIEGLKSGMGQGESIRQIETALKEAGLIVSHGEGGRFSITKVA